MATKKGPAELLLCKSFAFVFGGRALRVATQTASPELFYTTLYRLVIASNRQIQDHSQSDGLSHEPGIGSTREPARTTVSGKQK